MALSVDPPTRSTRRAAAASATAVVAAAALWAVTTQIGAIRSISPFAEDPWDAVATFGAIFLSLIAGSTWVRSLRHRGAVLPTRTARRIRWGAGLAAGIVLVMAGTDAEAIAVIGFPPGAAARAVVITALVVAALLAAVAALLLAIAAAGVAMPDGEAPNEPEPDIVDDLVALAVAASGPIRLRRPVERFGSTLEGFLDGARWSPRRHRVAFGVVASLAIGVVYSGWHVLREGPPPNPGALVVFVLLMASGVLAAYLGTVAPLRLLRPPER